MPGGFDFYFAKKNEAQAFVEYLKATVICGLKSSKQLHGTDVNNSIAYYQHTFNVEVPPVCKGDLVLLPRQLARDIAVPLVLCTKVSASMTFIHPASMKVASRRGLERRP